MWTDLLHKKEKELKRYVHKSGRIFSVINCRRKLYFFDIYNYYRRKSIITVNYNNDCGVSTYYIVLM